MIPALYKTIISVLLCTTLLFTFDADARVKYYRYNGNVPFIEMMLNMMVAMGIIQPVSPYAMYGASPYNRYGLSSLGLGQSWPYGFHSAYPFSGVGADPFSSYSLSSLGPGQAWPYSGYTGYPYSSYAGYPYDGYDGWSRSGWPGSAWSDLPLTIDPLLGFPGRTRYSSWNRHSPAFDRNFYRALNYDRYGYDDYDDYDCYGGLCDNNYYAQRYIDGLWVSGNGEMIGFRDGRFLWSDGNTAYSTGLIELTPRYMRAYVDNSDQQIVYRYKLRRRELLTMDGNGNLRIFHRVPVNQVSAYLNRQNTGNVDGHYPEASPEASVEIGLLPETGETAGLLYFPQQSSPSAAHNDNPQLIN